MHKIYIGTRGVMVITNVLTWINLGWYSINFFLGGGMYKWIFKYKDLPWQETKDGAKASLQFVYEIRIDLIIFEATPFTAWLGRTIWGILRLEQYSRLFRRLLLNFISKYYNFQIKSSFPNFILFAIFYLFFFYYTKSCLYFIT